MNGRSFNCPGVYPPLPLATSPDFDCGDPCFNWAALARAPKPHGHLPTPRSCTCHSERSEESLWLSFPLPSPRSLPLPLLSLFLISSNLPTLSGPLCLPSELLRLPDLRIASKHNVSNCTRIYYRNHTRGRSDINKADNQVRFRVASSSLFQPFPAYSSHFSGNKKFSRQLRNRPPHLSNLRCALFEVTGSPSWRKGGISIHQICCPFVDNFGNSGCAKCHSPSAG